jgi:RimJ/RimL family protein N-acetyltransferase
MEYDIIPFEYDNQHFYIYPAIYLNLNQKLIQKFYSMCKEKEILKSIEYENNSKHFTLKHCKKFLENSLKEFDKKNLTFYLMQDQIIGVFMVKDISNCPEIGYFLIPSYRNRGLGKQFISFMVHYLSPRFHSMMALVHKDNESSLKILKSLRFNKIKTMNEVYVLKKSF